MDMVPGTRSRQKWFIITSEEIARIRELLADTEWDEADRSRKNAKEISRMITLIERRLV
jgi:hypothetical protein